MHFRLKNIRFCDIIVVNKKKGLIKLSTQLKKVLCSTLIVLLCCWLFSLMIYADKSKEYTVEDSEIDVLFESEQKILESYAISAETEDIPTEALSNIENNEEEYLDNAELLVCQMIENMKIVEFEEEFIQNNKLACREIESLDAVCVWPVEGYTRISSPYGWRICPFHGREFHSGIDIPGPAYTDIKATKSGVVKTSKYSNSYGNYIVLTHNDGSTSLYAHLIKSYVSVGQEVERGEVIGAMGSTGNSTGNHLHFEMWTGSDSSTRVNPMNYF